MNSLGVSLKMITGDNQEIAKNIGGQIGLDPDKILVGEDLSSYSLSQLNKKVLDIDIFAEISPNQKEKIIRAYKEAGEIVGYMGDGINDAPAIKVADVGISVDTAADTAKMQLQLFFCKTVSLFSCLASRKEEGPSSTP